METFYEKMHNEIKHFNKEELLAYFNACLEGLNVKDKEKYALEILYDSKDYKKTIDPTTFTLDYRAMIIEFYKEHPDYYFGSVWAINLMALEKLHAILAYIELKENLEHGFMHLMEPEAFICFTNEMILNKDILLSHYCTTMSYIYTAKLLKECKVRKEIQKAYNYDVKDRIFKDLKQNKHPLFMRAILHDETPSSIIWRSNGITVEKLGNDFSTDFVKKYEQAYNLFRQRKYFICGRSYAPIQINELREKQLNNVSLGNKLIFGKSLTEKDKRILNSTELSNIDLPDFSEKKWLDMTFEGQKMRQ